MILAAVVDEYVLTALPVGSKTVVKKGLKASPATVRNEMSELEEQGFLEKPHTSAGRVPADRGFRYYVDHLLDRRRLMLEDRRELDRRYRARFVTVEELIARTARALSELSRQVGVAVVAPAETALLSAVSFWEAGPGQVRVILQMMDGSRDERLIKNERGLDAVTLNRLSNLLNKIAPGRSLIGLRRELLRQMEETRAQADLLLARAVELSEQVVTASPTAVFVSGQDHLFDLPEFAEAGRLREMVRTLEEKTVLARLLEQATMTAGLRVIIGMENSMANMRDCAVIASSYGRGEARMGTLGVIGPTRMDYARLIPLVYYTSELISECLRRG